MKCNIIFVVFTIVLVVFCENVIKKFLENYNKRNKILFN